jgi:hypothetical protein
MPNARCGFFFLLVAGKKDALIAGISPHNFRRSKS